MPDSFVSLKGKILSGDREISQAQLLENVARAAAGLSAIGIGAEATVAIMLRNDFPFFEASMAANAVGAYAVPINWHFQAEEAGYILGDSQAQVLVVHADLFPQIRAGIPEGVQTFVVPTPPEIQAAYRIAPDHAIPPVDLPVWSDWVSRQGPRELTPTAAPFEHDLHLRHHRHPERRAAPAFSPRVSGAGRGHSRDRFRVSARWRLSHRCDRSHVSRGTQCVWHICRQEMAAFASCSHALIPRACCN